MPPRNLPRNLSGDIHLSSLVLGDLVLRVLAALLGLAVRPAGFGNVDLMEAQILVSVL